MLGVSGDKLVCVYTVADQHNSTEAKLYMKSSSSNGFAWTAPKEVFADKTGVSLITVNSWNEWTETSYLLPDNVNGYGYLEAIKRVFKEETNI
jgi:hypothetical protein